MPESAYTLTIPAIMAADFIACVVPGPTKIEAVKQTLNGDITTDCPASVLRRHKDAVLCLDREASE